MGRPTPLITRHPSPITRPLAWQAVAEAVTGQTLGRRFVYLQTTGSTSDVARHLAEQGEPEGAAVFADEQTAGRGRAGKSRWLTPARTSIALSLVLHPPLAPADLPVLSMMAGVAAVDAIRGTTGVAATLKWPNDVVASGRKVGGNLVETALATTGGPAVRYAVLGIGVNGNLPARALGPWPDAALAATTLQDEAGAPISREALVVALLRELEQCYTRVRRGDLASIRNRYCDLLDTLGRQVRVLAGPAGPAVEGVAEAVAPDGALVVRLPSGVRRRFAYGEVSIRSGR